MGFAIRIKDYQRGAKIADVSLADMATVKLALAVESADDDALIAVYASAAKSWMEQDLGRPLDNYGYTLAFPAGVNDTDGYYLHVAPVATCTSPDGTVIPVRTRDGFTTYVYWSDVKDTDAFDKTKGVVNLHVATEWQPSQIELLAIPYLTLIAEFFRNREARVRKAEVNKAVRQALTAFRQRQALPLEVAQRQGVAAQSPEGITLPRQAYQTIEILYGWGTAGDGITGRQHEATILAGVPEGIATDLLYPVRDVAVQNARGRTGGYFNIFLPEGWELYRERIWGDSEVGQRRVGNSQWWSRFSSSNIAGTIFKVVAVKPGETPQP